MKNNVNDYNGLSEDDKKYLKEFDKALDRGIFDDKLIKMTKKMKKSIENDRNSFKRDITHVFKRKGNDVDSLVIERKLHVGKKKVKVNRDENGQFKKKETK